MSLAAELAAVLARWGAPTALAVRIAEDVAASALPKIERAERNRKIRAQFHGTHNLNTMRELFGLSRSSLYLIAKQSNQEPISLDKSAIA